MGDIQKTDKAMRVIAIIGGIIALVEAIANAVGIGFWEWGFGIIGTVLAIVLAVVAIFLGIKPLRYTPFILLAVGVLLIVFAALIGGIFVLLAAFMGLIS